MHEARLLFVALVAFISGCTGQLDPYTDSSSDSVGGSNDPTDMQFLARLQQYQTFTPINSSPYLSTVGAFDINVFADGDVTSYRSIHPETTNPNADVAEGTMIVRTVLDASGNVSELTAVAKAPAGYDSTIGDWWFAATDPAGNPLTTNGVLQVGRLDACHTCHIPRSADDYLFGVPAADESSTP